jgi:diguanylate cyclase (GGDEF)-like protein
VVAAERTRVIAVNETIFWNLVNASHDFAINLLFSLAGRLRANNSTVSNSIRLQREYKKNAMVDALTGLYNRRWLEEALPRFINRYARGAQALGLLMMDVDHFKSFNDRYGHPAGDAVLVMVAKTLRENLRPMDHVARYGGEEFVVLLPDTDGAGARHAAERLRLAVGQTPASAPDGQALPQVTISIGGASLAAGQTASELLSIADGRLYESKKNGRNRVTF